MPALPRYAVKSSAARNLHADYRQALDIVLGYYRGKLIGIINIIELGTAYESYTVSYKLIMKISVCIRSAVCRNKQVCSVKIRCVYRDELYLYGPLRKTARICVFMLMTFVIHAAVVMYYPL